MSTGVSLQLFDGATPRANLTGIQALWWDVTEPKDASRPVGKSVIVTTDVSGFIKLDLSNVTGLSLGQSGFLMLYKLDAGNQQDSLVFSGEVATSDVLGGVDMYYYDSGWVRPAEWLPLPVVAGTEQKVVGLRAIYDSTDNYVGMICAGGYTVNWGDGVTENFASGVRAQHQYSFSNAALDGTLVTRKGITYKQAIITITPQAGQNLTTVDLAAVNLNKPSSNSLMPYLDLVISSPTLSALTLRSSVGYLNVLEQVALISSNSVTNFDSMLSSCPVLQSIPIFNMASCTSATRFLSSCYQLRAVPALNLEACVDASRMFSGCYSLERVPPLNLPSATNCTAIFSWCSSLRKSPALTTPIANSLSSAFEGCASLIEVGALSTASATSLDWMFSGCESLETLPLFSLANVIDISGMFSGCSALKEIPLFVIGSTTPDVSNLFLACPRLAKAAISGLSQTISVAECDLSAVALNEIYTNLATVTSKTITVSGNWGRFSDNPTIAIAKGWTVTG